MSDFFSVVLLGIMGVCLLIIMFALLVFAPIKAMAKADCLEQGYPQAKVTWNLNKYCVSPYSNLGDVNPKVVPLN